MINVQCITRKFYVIRKRIQNTVFLITMMKLLLMMLSKQWILWMNHTIKQYIFFYKLMFSIFEIFSYPLDIFFFLRCIKMNPARSSSASPRRKRRRIIRRRVVLQTFLYANESYPIHIYRNIQCATDIIIKFVSCETYFWPAYYFYSIQLSLPTYGE